MTSSTSVYIELSPYTTNICWQIQMLHNWQSEPKLGIKITEQTHFINSSVTRRFSCLFWKITNDVGLTWQMLVLESPRDICRHNNKSPQDPDFIVTPLMTPTITIPHNISQLLSLVWWWPPGGEIIEERKLIWRNKNIFLSQRRSGSS